MRRTLRKIEEARYFLRQMEENCATHPEYDYCLSAFVSAARSVTWVMKAECQRIAEWSTWYESKNPSAEEKKLLRELNEVRIRSEKFDPIETRITLEFEVPPGQITDQVRTTFQSLPVGSPVQIWALEHSANGLLTLPSDAPPDAVLGKVQKLRRTIPEFPEEEIFDVCERYMKLLDDLFSSWTTETAP